jgi:hypothetical protein
VPFYTQNISLIFNDKASKTSQENFVARDQLTDLRVDVIIMSQYITNNRSVNIQTELSWLVALQPGLYPIKFDKDRRNFHGFIFNQNRNTI